MRYENIYSSFPCPASGHFSAASRRVAPISGSVSSSDRPVYWVGHAGFAKQAGMACSIYEDRLSNAFIFIYFCTKFDWQESACGRFVVSKAHLLVDL